MPGQSRFSGYWHATNILGHIISSVPMSHQVFWLFQHQTPSSKAASYTVVKPEPVSQSQTWEPPGCLNDAAVGNGVGGISEWVMLMCPCAQQGSFLLIYIHWLLFSATFRHIYAKIFQQPYRGRSHKTSVSHFNQIDFCIPSSLLSCQFCVAKFLALIGLFNFLLASWWYSFYSQGLLPDSWIPGCAVAGVGQRAQVARSKVLAIPQVEVLWRWEPIIGSSDDEADPVCCHLLGLPPAEISPLQALPPHPWSLPGKKVSLCTLQNLSSRFDPAPWAMPCPGIIGRSWQWRIHSI